MHTQTHTERAHTELAFPHVFTEGERAAGFLPSPGYAHAHSRTHMYPHKHTRTQAHTHVLAHTHPHTGAHTHPHTLILSPLAAPRSPAPGVSLFSLRAPNREDR